MIEAARHPAPRRRNWRRPARPRSGLGVEAARHVGRGRAPDVDALMERQLDQAAGELLQREGLDTRGIAFFTRTAQTEEILGTDKAGGRRARRRGARSRPISWSLRSASAPISTWRGGRPARCQSRHPGRRRHAHRGAPDIYAVGECIEHNGGCCSAWSRRSGSRLRCAALASPATRRRWAMCRRRSSRASRSLALMCSRPARSPPSRKPD